LTADSFDRSAPVDVAASEPAPTHSSPTETDVIPSDGFSVEPHGDPGQTSGATTTLPSASSAQTPSPGAEGATAPIAGGTEAGFQDDHVIPNDSWAAAEGTRAHDETGLAKTATIEGIATQALAATQAFNARADFYENLVRQLQQRVETLQADQIQELLSPVFLRLAVLLTQAADSASRSRAETGKYAADVEFEYFADLIVETLGLMNVNSVQAEAGAVFDRTLHAARKSVPTDDQTLSGTIAKVLRYSAPEAASPQANDDAAPVSMASTPPNSSESPLQPEPEGNLS
jgi:molecular chaperone GrpE (heat shock protein)